VDGGTPQTLLLTADLSSASVSAAATHIDSLLDSTASAAATSITGHIQITSADTGTSSSIAVSASATAGYFTGDEFTGYDFRSPDSENLVVTVDGVAKPALALSTLLTDIDAAVSAINAISGLTATKVGTTQIRLTSDATSASSSIAIDTTNSEENAKALFGSDGTGEAVAGTSGSNALALFGSSAGTAVQGTTGGILTIASTKKLTSTDNTVLITAYDVDFDGGIDSGTAAITIHGSMDDQTIALGAAPSPAAKMQLDGTELQLITNSGGLTLGSSTSGSMTVNGMADANSVAVGPVTLLATKATKTVTFATAASLFNKGITVQASEGVTLQVDVTTVNSASTINAGAGDPSTTAGTLTIVDTKTFSTTNQELILSAFEINIQGTTTGGGLTSGTAAMTIHGSEAAQTIGLGAGSGNLALSDAEIGQITATAGLTVGGSSGTAASGVVTVEGITDGNSGNFETLSLVAEDTGSINVVLGSTASTFNKGLYTLAKETEVW